jgi:hypothetical protein
MTNSNINRDTHTIATPVNGVRHLSDIQIFEAFRLPIDEQGHDLWGYRAKQDKTIGKRQDAPKFDDLHGNPGSKERIEWLRGHYENDTKEISPFDKKD